MNKPGTIITILTMGLIMLALTAIGEENYEIRSVAEASVTEDGTWVTVQGNITEKLRDNYFLLVDETGQIELKVRGDEWGQYSYDPEKTAQVYGKIFREDGVAKIEAKKGYVHRLIDIAVTKNFTADFTHYEQNLTSDFADYAD